MSLFRAVVVGCALPTACGYHVERGSVPAAAVTTAMCYGIEMLNAAVAELAEVAPVAASVLLAARAQPTIDPVDMRQNVRYFSAKPTARSVHALLAGDENGFRLADPLAAGTRLRALFRTLDDASAQDGRVTLSIEAKGDNATE